MGLQYVVAKRIFGFDKDKNVKYVAKSVGAGELDFDKLCAKVSRILGIHRKTVDLVAGSLYGTAVHSESKTEGRIQVCCPHLWCKEVRCGRDLGPYIP